MSDWVPNRMLCECEKMLNVFSPNSLWDVVFVLAGTHSVVSRGEILYIYIYLQMEAVTTRSHSLATHSHIHCIRILNKRCHKGVKVFQSIIQHDEGIIIVLSRTDSIIVKPSELHFIFHTHLIMLKKKLRDDEMVALKTVSWYKMEKQFIVQNAKYFFFSIWRQRLTPMIFLDHMAKSSCQLE